jgi:hypothetical protein
MEPAMRQTRPDAAIPIQPDRIRRQERYATMTINVLRGRGAARRTTHEAMPEPLPIGDDDSEIFNCPACARPLAVGARRCPGCRTRLMLGVQLKRAGVFMAAGMAGGLALTTAFVMVSLNLGLAALPAAGAQPLPVATAGTGTIPAASAAPAPSAAPVPPAIPPASLTALGRTAEMNARIAGGIPTLQAALAGPSVDTGAIAEVFRTMTADAAYAAGAAERLGRWDDAVYVSAGLGALYADIRATAREGLAKSLSNAPAYRAAAETMLAVLAGLAPLDAASRDLGEAAGIELPAVNLPDLAPPVDAPDSGTGAEGAPAP